MARKYFSGEISKREILDSFPAYENDYKLRLLFNRVVHKPRKGWLFGVSKEAYEIFITETYELIDELETGKLKLKILKTLLKELRVQTSDYSEPIENMWFTIQEVAKFTSNTREEITGYLNLLVEKGIIKKTSEEPLLYEFSEKGKELNNDFEIEKILSDVA
tara:strand:- start:1712 stop:2197 length:486 start_codon:yes stop_codon:yes gene_type:complete